MPRNPNLLPAIAVTAILVGGAALYVHNHMHQTASQTAAPRSATTQQATAPTVTELASASCHMKDVLPDPNCTPGASNPDVTQDNIHQTICVSGYTKTIRPPVSYTDKLKTEQMQEYGFTDSIHTHEEDHLVSLELGGAPEDPKNLWPEPGNSPNPKDKVEDFLHKAVCNGQISLHDAQTRIATDWTTAEQGL